MAITDEREPDLAALLRSMDVPDSLRAEIIRGRIVMSPIGRVGHGLSIDIVYQQLRGTG